MNVKQLQETIRTQSQLMREVNRFIYTHPELGYEERNCSAYLVERFKRQGLMIEQPVADIATAFRATLAGDKDRPKIGLVLLYDAVPAVESDGSCAPNHSCGHNVIAGAVVGTVAALTKLTPRYGSVVVMGLPADEIAAPLADNKGGAKAATAATGTWDDLDAVLYAHPEFINTVSSTSRWMTRIRISLSHARQFSQRGELPGSIVGAVQELLKAIQRLEERHTQEYLMVKGMWLDGDVEGDCKVHAQLRVLVFGDTEEDLKARTVELQETVSAVSASAEIPIAMETMGETHMGVHPNHALTGVVHEVMTLAGLDVVVEPPPLPFATDFGNISQRVPGALIGVGREGGWHFHTAEGAAEFVAEEAERVMFGIADVLVLTTIRLFEDSALINRIHAEHKKVVS